MAVEHEICEKFIKNGWTLCIAESCTGGAVAAELTAIPGTSRYFLGSFVVYSNHLKSVALGVSHQVLETYGAVSKETVAEMLDGALRVSGSEFAAAVSGIAGPDGGTPDKPVGTVWCGVARKGRNPHFWLLHFTGSRSEIVKTSANALLKGILEYSQ